MITLMTPLPVSPPPGPTLPEFRPGNYSEPVTDTLGRVPDSAVRLTQFARGGGCACKIPPGELEETVARLIPDGPGTELMVGVEHGDDGAVVRVRPDMAIVVTADFFTPVVDDAYTFGRIAATNALSDIYAMGGVPLVAVNLLGWPRDKLPAELAAEVLRGGLDVGRAASCHVAGGHSIDDPEPKYGMAVTGTADPAALLRIDAGRPGLPLSLTKPIGTGVLNAWHKATGQVSAAAIEVMTLYASRRVFAGSLLVSHAVLSSLAAPRSGRGWGGQCNCSAWTAADGRLRQTHCHHHTTLGT